MTQPFYAIPIEEWPAYQQLALERLHLKLTGVTHELLTGLEGEIRDALMDRAEDEGKLDAPGFHAVMRTTEGTWKDKFLKWQRSFAAARQEAAVLALASVARWHLHYWMSDDVEEASAKPPTSRLLIEQIPPFGQQAGRSYAGPLPFAGDLGRVLDEATHHLWRDGFTLSGRLWRLDANSLNGVRATLYEGMARGKSVWEIAKDLEQYLGANADCPRWTEQRLGITPSQIAAGDETGLIRAGDCQSEGVAYNALRLARNEIQIAHSRAASRLMQLNPWVIGERLYLHDMHPPDIGCECEQIAGWPKSRVSEVYPVGTIQLPLHVHCMCYLLPELMSKEDFADRRERWRRGEPWPEMDQYIREMGAGLPVPLRMLPPRVFDGSPGSLWWLLLLVLAEVYRRWSEAKEKETDQALEIGD